MKNEAIKILQKKKRNILETWMKFQMADETLREDLMSNEELRSQSDELVNVLADNLSDANIDDINNPGFEPVLDILNSISISRAKQGFTPRETGTFVLSLKESILSILQQEIKDPQELLMQSQKINKLVDSFGIATFESYLKER